MKRILGEVSNEVVEKWQLYEYKNKKIVMYPEAKEHSKDRHINDYKSVDDYYYVMDSLEEIINNPDYVFYDKSKAGLEYYKNIRGNILVAIRVVPGKELKVRSVYPVEQEKINNRRKKEMDMKMYNKYVIAVEI
ncbi:MAG: hypothetical protein MRZ42_00465 [Tenericutes bacterium]|nr:hypothetical protein [Mycoplasmatota bacterium]